MGVNTLHRIQIRLPKERHGTLYGGWQIYPEYINKDSVVYSFGVGEDISFDLSLIRKYGVRVHAFDPTPRAIDFVRSNVLPDQFVFMPYGVSDYDGVGLFYPPANPNHVSHTLLNTEAAGTPIEVEIRRLPTLMACYGHSHIDVLKLDIEGSEYAVLADLIRSDILVTQLLVEYHHRISSIGRAQTEESVRVLKEHGYEIFHISPNGAEYALILREAVSA